MTRYDIAIIGSGPAGVSAAITSRIRNKQIVLFGNKELSLKMAAAHEIMNYPGLPQVAGKDLVSAFKKQLEQLEIPVTEQKVTAVYAMGDYFSLQLGNGEIAEAKTVILASGVVAGKPYPNEEQFLGRGVSYCATCDAPLYKGKTVAVIAGAPSEEAEADFLAEVCEKVYYLPLYKEEVHTGPGIEVIGGKPVEILGDSKVTALKTTLDQYDVDCVFILREAQFPGQLVPGIETEGPAVKVNLQMETNIPGLFACGDIAGLPYQYVKAAGQGNVAALSAVSYLAKK